MTGTQITERLLAISQRVNAAPVGPYVLRNGPSIWGVETDHGDFIAGLDCDEATAQLFAHARSDLPFLLHLVVALMEDKHPRTAT